MARQWRIEYEGAYYHVLSRGNEKRDIFRDNKDRGSFLEVLGDMSERFDVEVCAYILMGNHYHLLLKTRRGNLSKAMQWLGTTYTRRFNLKNSRSGHLFQGRFKSMVIENEAYLVELSCYIHRNPLRAGIVNRLIDYRWSSYPAYVYGRKHPPWLKMDLILSQFGGRGRRKAYQEKVQGYVGEEKRIFEDLRHGFLLGSKEFVEGIRMRYLGKGVNREIPQQRKVLRDVDLEEFVKRATTFLGINLGGVEGRRRVRKSEREDRDLLIYLLWEGGRYRGQEIGDMFGLGYSSVSRRAGMIKVRMGQDDSLGRKVNKLKSIIKM